MISKIKKLIKGLLGIQPQEAPVLGNGEKRLQQLLAIQQEMLERQQFVQRQRGANQKAESLLSSMKAHGLLPHQVKVLEEEFLLEDMKFEKEFLRILNGGD